MGDYGSLSEYKQLNFIETNTFDVITDLACIQTWFIASDDGVINLSSLVELAQANEAKLYLAERDVWHHKRLGREKNTPVEAFWSDRTLQHAAVIWELGTANTKTLPGPSALYLTNIGTRGIRPRQTQTSRRCANDVERRTHCDICLLSVNMCMEMKCERNASRR